MSPKRVSASYAIHTDATPEFRPGRPILGSSQSPDRRKGTHMKSTLVKILGSFAVLGAAASVAGLGTFATFTSSTNASQSIQSGTVSITLGATGPANRLTVGAPNLALGSLAALTTGSTDHLRVTLTLPASAPNTLQGQSSSISYNFVGTQRVAAAK